MKTRTASLPIVLVDAPSALTFLPLLYSIIFLSDARVILQDFLLVIYRDIVFVLYIIAICVI
jgi:hypothetical protein